MTSSDETYWDTLRQAVAGELPGDQYTTLLEEAAQNPALARDLRFMEAYQQSLDAEKRAEIARYRRLDPGSAPQPTARWRRQWPLAALAVAAAFLLLWLIIPKPSPTPDIDTLVAGIGPTSHLQQVMGPETEQWAQWLTSEAYDSLILQLAPQGSGADTFPPIDPVPHALAAYTLALAYIYAGEDQIDMGQSLMQAVAEQAPESYLRAQARLQRFRAALLGGNRQEAQRQLAAIVADPEVQPAIRSDAQARMDLLDRLPAETP